MSVAQRWQSKSAGVVRYVHCHCIRENRLFYPRSLRRQFARSNNPILAHIRRPPTRQSHRRQSRNPRRKPPCFDRGGGVSHAPEMQNPGGNRGFARLLWWAAALAPYRIGMAGANACLPFLPVALDGAGYGAALLWGGI